MSQRSFKDGANAGRNGSEPHPPSYNSFLDPLFGVNEQTIKESAKDYMRGYEAGSHQREADARERE
jgi:hypothetical protein